MVAFIFAAILLLPILFSLKSDGTLGDDAKWVAIWTPMWIVDFLLLIAAVVILFDNSDPPPKTEEDEPEPEPKIPLMDRLYNFFSSSLFVLIQIFVLIRLDKYVDWSWFVVFIPWFLYEALQAVSVFELAYLTIIVKPDYDNISLILEEGQSGEEEMFMLKIELESAYFEKVLEQKEAQKSIFVNALRAWLAVFLALQLDNTVQWNWGLVLLPIWVYLFMQYVYAYVFRSWGASKLHGLDLEAIEKGEEKDPIKMVNSQQGSQLMASSTFICLSQGAPLFMAILLVSRLEVSDITTFVIILPIFIAIGCCCCGVFCGICVMSCIDMEGMERELREAQGGAAQHEEGYVPPDAEAGEGGDGSQGSADSTSPFQTAEMERSTDAASGAGKKAAAQAVTPAPVPAPAPVTAAPEQIEVDID